MKRVFADDAWFDYLHWQSTDKQTLKKVNALIKDIERTPYSGIGKPEPLKHEWSGYWSRRIDEKHRSVYRVIDLDTIEFVAFRSHYGDH